MVVVMVELMAYEFKILPLQFVGGWLTKGSEGENNPPNELL
jgi:hypothetical protein